MIAALLTTWLVLAAFPDTFTCTVTGYVYTMPEEAADFTRTDGCQMIQHRVEGGSLVLFSRHYWVRIVLPTAGEGFTPFWYRWGSASAHVRAQDWPISWGRVLRG